MRKLKYILALAAIFTAFPVLAQQQNSMRLNEILTYNVQDFEDDFGAHNGWIELFNTSYGTVDIGGCYLSNDPNNLKMYIIPKGDVLTKIKPRQHILFWADGKPFHGTFHINFELKDSKEVLFISSDGRTIIDRIIVPQMPVDSSYGRLKDGIGSINGDGEGWGFLPKTSPSTNNSGVDAETKSMIMAKTDPHGGIMAITAMSVVFLALILLCLAFKFTGSMSIKSLKKKSAQSHRGTKVNDSESTDETNSEYYAAIAMALHLYITENEAHDDESFAITLSHTDRTYSPWSSKIYGLRQIPQIKK